MNNATSNKEKNMNKSMFGKILVTTSFILIAGNSFADGFKRFSVSAGWLHVMPQGTANPFNINTIVPNGQTSKVGMISPQGFMNALDPNAIIPDSNITFKTMLTEKMKDPAFAKILLDKDKNVNAAITGATDIHGLNAWRAQGTGLEAEDVDTLGLMMNYYINDNVSLQLIAGLPPKVDISGKGEITAPMSGMAHTGLGLEIPLKQDIPITNLGNKSKAATVRAWTPAIEAQYQFGKSGVNKLRPYVGVGVMYAHFSHIKLNGEINNDLVAAGHMIQNVMDNKAGAALDRKTSSANPFVKVKTTDAIAPIFSVGATYDFTENWYGVASVSYAKLDNQAKIDVIDANTGKRLIHSTTKVDIDPIITYVGVGYRF